MISGYRKCVCLCLPERLVEEACLEELSSDRSDIVKDREGDFH